MGSCGYRAPSTSWLFVGKFTPNCRPFRCFITFSGRLKLLAEAPQPDHTHARTSYLFIRANPLLLSACLFLASVDALLGTPSHGCLHASRRQSFTSSLQSGSRTRFAFLSQPLGLRFWGQLVRQRTSDDGEREQTFLLLKMSSKC